MINKNSNVKKAKWTVLFYIDGKNNLAPLAFKTFQDIKAEGSNEDVNLVAMVGVKVDKEVQVKEGRIPSKEEMKKLKQQAKVDDNFDIFPGGQDMGKLDMGDPKTLKEFIIRNMKKYPAEHFALVLWDHGAGFKGSMVDESSHHIIDNRELREVLKEVMKETGKKIDLIQFNACLMGQLEVMNALEGVAKYVVASPETQAAIALPIPGLYGTTPQPLVIRDLKQGIKERGDITPEELAKLYVFESRNQFGAKVFTPTMGAYDLKYMPLVRNSVEELAKNLIADMKADPEKIEHFRDIVKNKLQHYLALDILAKPYRDFADIGHLAMILKDDRTFSKEVRESADKLLKALDKFVIIEEHVDESQHGRPLAASTGLSVYLPTNYGHDLSGQNPIDNIPVGGTHGYENTLWAKATHWDELLKLISKDDDFIGKHPKLSRFFNKYINWVKLAGYDEAKAVLAGQTKIEPITFFGIEIPYISSALGTLYTGLAALGGIFKSCKALQKFNFLSKNRKYIAQIDKDHISEMTFHSAVDLAIGIGFLATAGALFAGTAGALAPVAAVTLGLSLGRAGLEIGRGYLKYNKASEMTVSQKLEYMKGKKHLTQPVSVMEERPLESSS